MEGIIANISTSEIEIPEKDSLKTLQDLVGGYIEVYHHEGRNWVVNEEGLLEGLPFNPFAMKHGLNLAGSIVEIHGVLP